MTRYLPLGIGITLVLAGTIVHGAMTLRWTGGSSEELAAVSERYANIPKNVGDWIGEDTKTSAKELKSAGAKATVSRRYQNPKTGKVVQVFLICGLARDTAVHTPDICYVGQGYKMDRAPYRVDLVTGDTKSQAYVSTFTKRMEERNIHQRILWSWNVGNGKGWQAPDSPRVTFRGWQPLNKVYLIAVADTPGKAAEAEKAELAEFANIFLPLVSRTLYPPAEPVASK